MSLDEKKKTCGHEIVHVSHGHAFFSFFHPITPGWPGVAGYFCLTEYSSIIDFTGQEVMIDPLNRVMTSRQTGSYSQWLSERFVGK